MKKVKEPHTIFCFRVKDSDLSLWRVAFARKIQESKGKPLSMSEFLRSIINDNIK